MAENSVSSGVVLCSVARSTPRTAPVDGATSPHRIHRGPGASSRACAYCDRLQQLCLRAGAKSRTRASRSLWAQKGRSQWLIHDISNVLVFVKVDIAIALGVCCI